MSDKLSPIAEPVTGFALRFDSQYALLAEGVKELRKSGIFKPGLERAISSLLARGGATSLAKMPQLLSRLSRNRQLGSLLTDIRGETLLANKAFFELTGYKLGDTTSGGTFSPEMYENDDGRLVRTRRLVPWLDAARSLSLVSARYSITDGTRGERIRWMQFCSEPLVADNRLEGVFTVVAEATEEVEIEARIQSVIGVLESQLADLSGPVSRLNSLIDRVHELNDFLPRDVQRKIYTPGFSVSLPDPTSRVVEEEPVSRHEIEELVALKQAEDMDDSREDAGEFETASGSTYESVLLAQAASEIAALEETIQESVSIEPAAVIDEPEIEARENQELSQAQEQPEILEQQQVIELHEVSELQQSSELEQVSEPQAVFGSQEIQANHFDPAELNVDLGSNEQMAEAVAENLYLDFSTDADNGHGPTLQENEILPAAYMDEIAEDVMAELHGEPADISANAIDGNLEVELMARAALEADAQAEDDYEPSNLEHIFDPESEAQLWNEFSDFAMTGLSESLAFGPEDQEDEIHTEVHENEPVYEENEPLGEAELMSFAETEMHSPEPEISNHEPVRESRYSSAPEDLIQTLARTLTDLPVIGPDALTVQAEEIELIAEPENFAENFAEKELTVVESIEAIEPAKSQQNHEEEADQPVAQDAAAMLSQSQEPEAEINEPAMEQPALSVTIIPESPEVMRAKRALVVDDIPVNVKLLVLQLKRLGYTTDTASNGRDALEALGRNQYDIVFMDCDMPVMDGYEATREIRRRELVLGTHMPIVAMTSYERTADKEKCVQAGMDECLVKGMHATAVSAVIQRINAKTEDVDQTQSTSSAAAIDFESLDNALEAAGHSQEELNEMVRMFMRSMETFVGSMQRAIDSKDGDLVIELASSIKGPSASLGLKPLTKVIQEVLTFAEAQDWPQVRLKYLKLKTAYLRSLDQLKKMCPSLFVEEAHRIG